MSTPCRFEQSVLSHEEYQTVRTTHHPAIYELDGKALQAARVRLRELHDKERTLARQKRREKRGKAEPRGRSFPGTAEQPQRRKQIFAAAIKRVNKELERLRALEARSANVEAAHRALALKRAANFVHHPASEPTAREGLNPVNNPRRRTRVPPDKIGSVSQQTKVAQAIRDARQ